MGCSSPARPERTITFAGPLDPGDWSAEDGMVTIHRQERDHLAMFLDCLPEGDRERFRELADSMRPGMSVLQSAATRFGATARSLRPGKLKRIPWMGEFAGLGVEDIVARQAPAAAEGFLPGHHLEVWLLPVVDATFEILLTPAGEWQESGSMPDRSPDHAGVPRGHLRVRRRMPGHRETPDRDGG